MKSLLLSLALTICSGGLTRADEPLPPFPPGMVLTSTANCQDPKTMEKGDCSFWKDAADNTYLIFGQGDELRFIRQFYDDGRPFVNLWIADDYGTF